MLGKVLSWSMLYAAFFCWLCALTSHSQLWVLISILAGAWLSLMTTYLAPHTVDYDAERYLMLLMLAIIAVSVSLWVVAGIVAVSVLLLPSVVKDFKGGVEVDYDEKMLALGDALAEADAIQDRWSKRRKAKQIQRRRAKVSAKQRKNAEDAAFDRAVEMMIGLE